MRIRRSVKTVIYLLLVALLACIAFVWWSFFTASGSDTSLSALQNRMQNLSYTYRSGNLATGIMLDDLEWQLKNKTKLLARDVELHWDPSCWRGKSFCLSSVKSASLRIVLPEGSSTRNPMTLPALDLPFSIHAEQLIVDEMIIEPPDKPPVFISNLHFNGVLQTSTLTAKALYFDWQSFQVSLNGTMELKDNYPVKLGASFSTIDQAIAIPIKSNWAIGGDLLELQLNGGFNKPYNATATGTYSLLDRRLPADIALKWEQAQWPIDDENGATHFDKGDVTIQGYWPDYKLNGDTRITGSNLPAINAQLSGTLNTNRISMNPLTLNTLGGVVDAKGVLKWRNGISWHSELEARDLWPNLYWPVFKGFIDGKATFNGRSHNGQTELDLHNIDATGSYAGQQISVAGSTTRLANGTWHLASMEATSEENTVTVNGSLGTKSNLNLYFSLNSPEDFLHDINGDLHGNLQISGNINKPDITGSASSSSLAYQDTKLMNTKVSGVLRSLGQEESDLTLIAESATVSDREISGTEISINGSRADHLVRVQLATDPLDINRMETTGSFDEHGNWRGKINTLAGQLAQYPFSLANPVTATWISDQRTFAIEPHCWSIEFSSLCVVDSALVGRNGSINFELDELNLAAIDALTPAHIGLEGVLNSQGQIIWQPGKAPSITVQSRLTDALIDISDTETREKLQLDINTATLDIATRRSTVTANLSLDARQFGTLESRVDIQTLTKNYPVSGSLSLHGAKLDWLQRYFPQIKKLTGSLSADGRIDGQLFKPRFTGTVNVADAAISSPQLPIDLKQINLAIAIDENKASMNGDAKSGAARVIIGGNGTLKDSDWHSDLRLQSDNLAIEHEYVKNALISTDLKIASSPAGITVGGSVNVLRADIVIAGLGNGAVPISSDVIVVDAKSTRRNNTGGGRQIRSAIDVTLGNDVHFTGYGLDADLLGDFRVALNEQRLPELRGDILVNSGTYRSYGQDLTIRDGRISFVGPIEQAVLSVEAVREVDNILAGMRIDGSLDNPKASLFSEPAMPEEEILSYVVLGRQLDFSSDTGALDDSRLLANAALFMGIRNGQNLSKNIASTFGIEDFSLSARGSGEETQVIVSGRLNNRLLVRYGVGVFNSVSTLFVRYDLAQKLYLETTQGFADGLEKAVDIYYAFDF